MAIDTSLLGKYVRIRVRMPWDPDDGTPCPYHSLLSRKDRGELDVRARAVFAAAVPRRDRIDGRTAVVISVGPTDRIRVLVYGEEAVVPWPVETIELSEITDVALFREHIP